MMTTVSMAVISIKKHYFHNRSSLAGRVSNLRTGRLIVWAKLAPIEMLHMHDIYSRQCALEHIADRC